MEVQEFTELDVKRKEDHIVSNIFYDNLGAEGLSQQAIRQNRNLYDLPLLTNFLNKNDKILEMGCGYGRLLISLRKKGFDVDGLDINPGMIEATSKNLEADGLVAGLTVACMSDTGIGDSTYDKIICIWSSYNHILKEKKQVQVLNEMYRLLSDKGQAMIEVLDGSLKINKYVREKYGFGESGRLAFTRVDGHKAVIYLHDKETLKERCRQSRFENFSVKYKNINKKRKIVITLQKGSKQISE